MRRVLLASAGGRRTADASARATVFSRASSSRGLLMVVGLSLASACGYRTTIAHPLHTGQVAPNEFIDHDSDQDRNLGLEPGTLDDSVSLSRLDSEYVCFNITFRDVNYEPLLQVQRRTYTLHIRGGDTLEDPSFEPRETQSRYEQSLVEQWRQTGVESRCATPSCDRVTHAPVRERRFVPGQNRISVGGGTLCFLHGGTITTTTSRITLKERLPPRNGLLVDRPRTYRWSFE